ncbi:MAG: transcription-repair coupling factor [Bacteroidales bacterium]|jgi:transcription-repair coupling factor (superfamily II helicase)|nr:transcription-repair coupling factor [Bacteroidales bacterium]
MKDLTSLSGYLSKMYAAHALVSELQTALRPGAGIHLRGLSCSSPALVAAALIQKTANNHVFIFSDAETAAYFHNDLSNILENDTVFFFPSSYKRMTSPLQVNEGNMILRTKLLEALIPAPSLPAGKGGKVVVSYAHAIAEKTVSGDHLQSNVLQLNRGERVSIDFIREMLYEYRFVHTDFVYEPGQFSVRGSIVDVFSYSHHQPYRIDFFGDEVESIRSFDIDTQLSENRLESIRIIPNMAWEQYKAARTSLFSQFAGDTVVWSQDLPLVMHEIAGIEKQPPEKILSGDECTGFDVREAFAGENETYSLLSRFCNIEFGNSFSYPADKEFKFDTSPQPAFNKNFELLVQDIASRTEKGYTAFLMSENSKQFDRLRSIFDGISPKAAFTPINNILHEGFIDHDLRICLYTDHQIFERYHKYRIRNSFVQSKSITMKELQDLHPGDFIVHVDHGVGIFGGLEKMEVNGKTQECIRMVYRDNDVLYVNIHNLHKVSRFRGKDSTQPKLNKLGTPAWHNLKQNTKRKVKDIARELILLYAKRRSHEGFSFSPDTYLQEELEASFLYEDTPDQLKATQAVKNGMESRIPMDHLVCGDVGFGKTEVAIRAAFKAVADSKQVAVLVPTTILALQHEQTFKERLNKFPCNIDSISRLKHASQQKATLGKLADGKVDILIGTHKLLGKDVKFKDLGLLIIDEEQKFGVAAKEKLKTLRVNVDTLTLTATPIPRTLQFSLMGVREMSVIATPPTNRHPIQTELIAFDREIIREAIEFEVSRGGQVFFIHNRVQTLQEVAFLIKEVCPNVSTVFAHGQMDGEELERIMLDFINGDYNVLISTSIIESGLDIPNANTIIIDHAHMFGLSDLHQLRGRVGRSNKKAFCYLIVPPVTDLTPEARRRLRAIEEFSDLGSGFNIAMQDLDIRGAGNLMGAEQSGFIAEIGFETYHHILNEAMAELREEEGYKEIFAEQEESNLLSGAATPVFVAECQIDTDLELLFSDDYIENVSERIHLYRELDNMDTEEKLIAFEQSLVDRFGAIPSAGKELINVVRLRWLAARIGIEKITLRNDRLLAYFVGNPASPYYQSDTFTKVLQHIQRHSNLFRLKEAKDRLAMSISPVTGIDKSMAILEGFGIQQPQQ